jgi:hypothetical protein
MRPAKLTYHIFLFICTIGLWQGTARAQRVEVSLNRNAILIGQQISLGLKVQLPATGLKANFSIPDSIPHFDIIRKGEIKAVKGESALEQVITFTSFDSGKWYFPSFPVLITDGARRVTIFSDSVLITVGYSPADSSGQLRDIKPVMDVEIVDYTIWYIIGAVLLALIIAYLLYRYFKNRKKKPAPVFKSALSPYEEAMRALTSLEESKFLDKLQVKEYHSELADIFRRYYSRMLHKDLLNKTTGDLLILLKEQQVDADTISVIAGALRYVDAVKFAKFLPLPSESREAHAMIKKGIQNLDNRSPQKT